MKDVEQKGTKKRYHDLDHLHGAWTKKQSEEFDKALADQREIDPQLWSNSEEASPLDSLL